MNTKNLQNQKQNHLVIPLKLKRQGERVYHNINQKTHKFCRVPQMIIVKGS